MEFSLPSSGLVGDTVPTSVNTFAWVALAFFSFLGPVVWGLECMWRTWQGKPCERRHVPYWSAALLFFSYALLIPGLFCTLFRYKVTAAGGGVVLQEGTESMFEFMHILNQTGCWYGAVLVALYAVVVPAVKLALLIAAEVLRIRSPSSLHASRMCIVTVQMISKWASPDMFAYVLLMYLMRALSHPPILGSVGHLDVGFTCFALYCVFSTIASLGVEAPEVPAAEELPPAAAPGTNGVQAEAPAVDLEAPRAAPAAAAAAAVPLPWLPRQAFPWLVAALVAGFSVLICVGLTMPVMSLRLEVDLLFEPTGTLPLFMKDFILSLHLDKLVRAKVNLAQLAVTLADWGFAGDANFFLAFVLLAGFAVLVTVLDVLMLAAVADLLHRSGALDASSAAGKLPEDHRLRGAVAWAYYLKKVTMLDVAVVGIVVVTLCGYVYRRSGAILSMEPGLLFLFFAEVCHYALYHMVMSLAKPVLVATEQTAQAAPSEGDDSASQTTASSGSGSGSACV